MKKETRHIILNWMPPAIPSFPSPAMSVLKSQMQKKGVDVKIVYWNFHLLPVAERYWGRTIKDFDDHLVYFLSPIFAYIALEMSDGKAIEKQREHWNKEHQKEPKASDDFLDHIKDCCSLFRQVVSNVLLKYDYEHCVFTGFYQKLFQMYGAEVVARLIKQKFPNIITVLGGIDTKDEALASMDNFPVFDYALWGEGEITLQIFTDMLLGNMTMQNIGNFVWREETELMVSKANMVFVNLDDSVIPDYSDYFEQAIIDIKKIRLPIEGSRGCHWARCRFCFHNEGTRYRRKSPQRIAEEIRMQIAKYDIHQISFLDNDIIGKDLDTFNKLLDELIAIRHDYPEFNITRAEIVTRNINADIVEKMVQAGFKDVQIGYEALSDELLTAIHKCNTFSSNLLFVKWAMVYGIKIRGANLIMNMLEETEENLQESLQNLYFLRFILSSTKFVHIYTTLWIKHSSKYFRILEQRGELDNWKVFKSFRTLPERYIKEENKYSLQFFVKPDFHPLWDDIESREWELINAHCTYQISKTGHDFEYQEFVNGELSKKDHISSKEWQILCQANRQIKSLETLSEECSIDTVSIISLLRRLKKMGLLYYKKNYQNIVTVINTSCEFNKQQRYT